jgi:phage-related protein
MAGGRPIRISVLGDSKDFETAMDRAARSAGDLETAMDKASATARSFDDRVEGVGDGADTLASKGAQAAGALAGLGEVVGGPVGGAMTGLGNAFQIAADSGDLLNAAIEGGGKVWNKAVGFVQSLTKAETYANLAKQAGAAAQWALNAAMSANPIMIVVLAIAALVAGLVWFFTQTEVGRAAWATFSAFIASAWAKAGAMLAGAWEGIKGAFSAGVAAVGGFLQRVLGIIKTVWAWSPYGLIINNWSTILSFFGSIPGKIKGWFDGAVGWLKSAGGAIVQGLWNGISGGYGWIKGKIEGWVGNVLDFVKRLFGIHSPSTVFAGYGRWMVQGLAKGLSDNTDLAVKAMSDVGAALNLTTNLTGPGGGAGIYIAPGAITVTSLIPDVEVGRNIVAAIREYESGGGRR